MKCAWQDLLNLLPLWMRDEVDKYKSTHLQELRLRINAPPVLISASGSFKLNREIHFDDLVFCVNIATKYSPWTTETIRKGFLTAPGGHRIGLCGKVIVRDGIITGIEQYTSICIRIARDYYGIANNAIYLDGSLLIIGRPGSGKTTFLRDLIRQRSALLGQKITVIDEKQEIFPQVNNKFCYNIGNNTDILSGCRKPEGVEMVLRNMSPDVIAVDEITAEEDCDALVHIGWCGVELLATAHAGNIDDLLHRPVYKPIIKSNIFKNIIVMRPDKSWYVERINE